MHFFLTLIILFSFLNELYAGSRIKQNATKDPIVFLNHFVAVVDWETAKSIDCNDFLRKEFSGSQKILGGYNKGAAHYFYGEKTYLEIFDPVGHPSADAKFSFGLGTDDLGMLNVINQKILQNFSLDELSSVGRLRSADERPWFSYTSFIISKAIYLWIMEYDPSFLTSPDITRKTSLKNTYKPKKILKDITSITASVTEKEFEILERIFDLIGYRKELRKNFIRFIGPDIKINLSVVEDAPGVKSIDFSLNKVKTGQLKYSLGRHSDLVFSKKRKIARWFF